MIVLESLIQQMGKFCMSYDSLFVWPFWEHFVNTLFTNVKLLLAMKVNTLVNCRESFLTLGKRRFRFGNFAHVMVFDVRVFYMREHLYITLKACRRHLNVDSVEPHSNCVHKGEDASLSLIHLEPHFSSGAYICGYPTTVVGPIPQVCSWFLCLFIETILQLICPRDIGFHWETLCA